MPDRVKHRTLAIPIIPMAGVALIITLMMMLAGDELMAHEDTPVNVPVARTMDRKTEDNITIVVLENPETGMKDYYYNDKPMSLEHVELKLRDTLTKGEPYMLIVLRADSTAPSQWVMELLSKVKKAGAQRVAISTKGAKGQTEEATE